MAVGNISPAVSEYGFVAILCLVVLAILATIVVLLIVRKDSQPTDFRIHIYGLEVRLRRGQLDTHEEGGPAELPDKHRSIWRRILRRLLKRGDLQ
jgi:hypothetical protein